MTDQSFGVTLLDAVRSDPDYQARRGKTLIFAADGASADTVSELLSGGHVPHVVYHKSRPKPEQVTALQTLREQDGTVMVCTDAAARGLDVQGITHVVQVGGTGPGGGGRADHSTQLDGRCRMTAARGHGWRSLIPR